MMIGRSVVMAIPFLLVAGAASAAPVPDNEVLSFTVLRNGDEVGTHLVTVRPDGDHVSVAVATSVVVKMAMVPVYRFEHSDVEVWKNGQLQVLDSTTNDDGSHHKVHVQASGSGLSGTADDKPVTLPGSLVPASLWSPQTVSQSALLNTLDGHAMPVKVADLGTDMVTVRGQLTQAHHYAMTGELARELWYDPSGALVQVRFKAKDDSLIQYVLKK
ncbi:DUF6134 family protein [Insolitispirillum peregrinum]|nr:DUF6134 family protein [Insolitispirillum peregrinum]